jgi:hypothetical protein
MKNAWAGFCGVGLVLSCSGSVRAELVSGLSGAVLKTETAGQVVTVWVENRGTETVPALGGTLEFVLEDVSRSGRLPRISGVKAVGVAGSPFTAGNTRQMNAAGVAGANWVAVLETQPDSPPSPVSIPAGARFSLAEVTLDTTGLGTAGGTWALKVSDPQGGGSFFNVLNPANPLDVLEVEVKAVESVLKVTDPNALGSTTVRWSASGNLVLEVDAAGGATSAPVVQETDDLTAGTWRAASAGAVLQGGVWHWEMPVDSTRTARFFRMVAAGVGPGSSLQGDASAK